mmetsp:Transcript_20969/g.67649  ORF Transcript_20969/g.67649 Transcript_20969/m.67649 type:complete len:101 (+) Transcript_20969:124-426(+)
MSAARFARLLVVPDGPGRSDNRLTCGGSGGGALDGGQTCGNDGPPAPCREDFAHLGDGQERAYRQASTSGLQRARSASDMKASMLSEMQKYITMLLERRS